MLVPVFSIPEPVKEPVALPEIKQEAAPPAEPAQKPAQPERCRTDTPALLTMPLPDYAMDHTLTSDEFAERKQLHTRWTTAKRRRKAANKEWFDQRDSEVKRWKEAREREKWWT